MVGLDTADGHVCELHGGHLQRAQEVRVRALVHRGQETSQCTGLNGSDPGGWGLGIEGHGQHMAGRASRQAPKWAQCEGTRWRTPEVDCAHETQSSGGDGRHPPGRQ